MEANFSFPTSQKLTFRASIAPNMADYVTIDQLERATEVFVFTQAIASNLWTVEHNLGVQISSITVVDSADSIIIPNKIIINDLNTVTIEFLSEFTGKAYIR